MTYSHLTPHCREPSEYLHEPYVARNWDPWPALLSLIVCLQILVVGSERHVCNATERTIAVQGEGQFRVNHGR